jgi:hypothetical protein
MKATGCKMRFDSRWGKGLFIFIAYAYRLALGPIQSPIRGVLETFPGDKTSGA